MTTRLHCRSRRATFLPSLLALALVLPLGGGFAQAQPRTDRGDRTEQRDDRSARGPQRDERNDRGNNNRNNNNRQSDNARQPQRSSDNGRFSGRSPEFDRYGDSYRNWRRGDRVPPQYRSSQYVVDNWRDHHLKAPPRGYHWVQVGGDYVLVAIATGIILQLLLQN